MRPRGCNPIRLQLKGGCFHKANTLSACNTAAARPMTEMQLRLRQLVALWLIQRTVNLFFSFRVDEIDQAELYDQLVVTDMDSLEVSPNPEYCKRRRGFPRRLLQITILFYKCIRNYAGFVFIQNFCRFRPCIRWPAIHRFFSPL